MPRPKTLAREAGRLPSALLLLALCGGAASPRAQVLRPVYDGRAEAQSSAPSEAEAQLVRRHALPAAQRLWQGDRSCQPEFQIVGAAGGSFTRPKAAQRAVLYRFCATGHNFANNGIAVLEGGGVVAHVAYSGGEDHGIRAAPDIDGNGLSEIVLSNGSTNQGYTVSVAVLIELSPSGVKKFGVADAYEDDCGVAERCRMTAYKISVRPGPSPVFYREAFSKRNERWAKTGGPARFSPREDAGSYRLLN